MRKRMAQAERRGHGDRHRVSGCLLVFFLVSWWTLFMSDWWGLVCLLFNLHHGMRESNDMRGNS
jgi:hypothetical protein